MEKSQKHLMGIDEVGRGPIAGPVAVGAFVFLTSNAKRFFRGVKESKQLTEKKREWWFEKILRMKEQGCVDFCVTFQSEKVIDTKGLPFAIKKCLETSIYKLKPVPDKTCILLDGGLKAPPEFIHQKTILKGDTKEAVIALASICAKVLRDRRMNVLSKKYPSYGFEVHKGYGTRGHYDAIKKRGLSPLHRRSFCKGLLVSHTIAKKPSIR